MLVGEKDSIEKMIVLCHTGPMLAEVKDVRVLYLDEEFSYEDFAVL